MGDERAVSGANDRSLHESDYLESSGVAPAIVAVASEREEAPANEAERARETGLNRLGAIDTAETLRMRWDTPRGRKVRALLLRDMRFEGSAHLAEILDDFRCPRRVDSRGAGGVPGFLDLRYVRLEGENLSHARLSRADLTGASLAKANLMSADLTESRLVRARLVGANLREADLSRADLTDANLTEASLDGATAVSALFGRARGIAASFVRASLVGADLRGAMLVRASFDEADLGGASVDGAHVLPGVFARVAVAPSGLTALNELVLGGEPVATPVSGRAPEPARLERTRTGSFVLHKLEAPASEPARRPSSRLPVPGLASASAPATPAPTGASRSWDAALSTLMLQRGRVARITVVLDGVEKVVFER